jgi:hypothetical protein
MSEEKQSASEKLKLVKVETKGVLGEYDHEIEFSNSESFVIVYGPNGVGKTKFLEIIYAASKINVEMLCELPFEEVKLTYDSGTTLLIAKTNVKPLGKRDELKIVLSDEVEEEPAISYTTEYGRNIDKWAEKHPYWKEIAPDVWRDIRDDELLTTEELAQIYPRLRHRTQQLSKKLQEFIESRVSAFLIETQRLQSNPARAMQEGLGNISSGRGISRRRIQGPNQSKIAELSDHMKDLISEAETQHSRITQRLDKTFPNRFLAKTTTESGTTDIQVQDVTKRYSYLSETRKQLANIVSLDLEDSGLPLSEDSKYGEFQLQLLDLYLDDMEDKYAPFDSLLKKINVLEEIVNTRLLNKTIHVTGNEGILVTNDKTGDRIDLEDLSSGEKHEIILMCDLLFSVPKGSIVLIDEPEISLHIAWQYEFIPDVKKIAQAADFRFIIATHSPQIINNDRDSSVQLGPKGARFFESEDG